MSRFEAVGFHNVMLGWLAAVYFVRQPCSVIFLLLVEELASFISLATDSLHSFHSRSLSQETLGPVSC